MPNNAPKTKVASVRRYGGEVIFCEPTLEARESTAASVLERTGAEFVHPYDDLRVMAGQGTAALELLEDVPDLDLILCPVGGGRCVSLVQGGTHHSQRETHDHCRWFADLARREKLS